MIGADWPNHYVAFINHWLDVYFGKHENLFTRLKQNSPLIRMLTHFTEGKNQPDLVSRKILHATLERTRVPVLWNGCFLVRPKTLDYLNSNWLDDFYSMVPATTIHIDENDFSRASNNDSRQNKLPRAFDKRD